MAKKASEFVEPVRYGISMTSLWFEQLSDLREIFGTKLVLVLVYCPKLIIVRLWLVENFLFPAHHHISLRNDFLFEYFVYRVLLSDQQSPPLTVFATLLEGFLAVVSAKNQHDHLRSVDFGDTYYGSIHKQVAWLYNGCPHPVEFAVVLQDEAEGADHVSCLASESSQRSGMQSEL